MTLEELSSQHAQIEQDFKNGVITKEEFEKQHLVNSLRQTAFWDVSQEKKDAAIAMINELLG